MTGEEIRKALALDAITTHAWRIQPCSAMTGANLLPGIDWAVEDVGQRMYFAGRRGTAPELAASADDVEGKTEVAA